VWTDSSAAIGICTRQGLGKLRHLDTHTLWVQQAVRTGRVDLRKVLGENNPADLLTKHSISRQRLEGLVTLFGCKYSEGRAESAPHVRKGKSSRTTMAQADRDMGETTSGDAEGLSPVLEVASHSESAREETSPIMPHLMHSPSELEVLYPKLEAPEDDKLDDAEDDARDVVYQAGLRMATQIRSENQKQGRKRRPDPEEHVAEEEHEDLSEQDMINLVDSAQPTSTSHSPLLRRRRSKKIWAIHQWQEKQRAQHSQHLLAKF